MCERDTPSHSGPGDAALVYKIVPAPLWREAERTGAFSGSAVDVRDGYIHLSTASQVADTAARHFAGLGDLLVVAIDAGAVPIRWELSRGGALFPHLYEPLPLSAVRWVEPLPLDAAGRHRFPSL
jgi:uncharacterized protein (DUF952 family)